MKLWTTGLLTLGLIAAVAFSAPAHQAQAKAKGAKPATEEQGEKHPQINAAIKALENAREHLQKAAHDFGGHRVDAIGSIDKALEQLRLAKQFDKI